MKSKEANKKPKAIIFGAGGGGRGYYRNNKNKYDFVAYSDNNKAIINSSINSISVISPEEIIKVEFQYIIVASMYVKEITDQLVNMGISKEKIIVPPKNQLKNGTPFAHKQTKDFARKVIFWITNLLDANRINAYVDFGTLLGFVRDGDILDWDDDIDMSVNDFDFELTKSLLIKHKEELPGSEVLWEVRLVYDKYGNNYGISLDCIPSQKFPIKKFDLFIRSRKRDKGFALPMGALSNPYIDESFFDGYDTIYYNQNPLKAPNNHLKYLKVVYGDWTKPKKGVSFSEYPKVDMKIFGNLDNSLLINKQLFIIKT